MCKNISIYKISMQKHISVRNQCDGSGFYRETHNELDLDKSDPRCKIIIKDYEKSIWKKVIHTI